MNPIFVALGFLFVLLGGIGVFLPVLPTVPFLLLASFFFAKGSPKFYIWFKGTWLYQNHLKDYEETRSMTLKSKLSILIPVSALLILTMALIDVFAMRIVILTLMLIKYYFFIFRIKTKTE